MNLLYLTFGSNPDIHSQAAFSIYSFLKEEIGPDSINVITDQPSFYYHLRQRVNIIPINKAELQDWEGEQQFFWRVKIKAIEKICAMYPGSPVMYVDTDTFLINGLAGFAKNLKSGKAYMHTNEGPLSAKKSKTEKRMWRQVQHKKLGGVLMQPSDCMWNAGVVATPNTLQNKECSLALYICDEMCRQGVTTRLIEQYALSLSLQKTYEMIEAKDTIAHYWSVKNVWNTRINAFFLEAYFSQWPENKLIQQLKIFDFTKTPIEQHTRNTNVRIKNFVDKVFPSQNHVYLPGSPS